VNPHPDEEILTFFRNSPPEMQQFIRNISDPDYLSLRDKLVEYSEKLHDSFVKGLAELGYVPPYNEEEMKADDRCGKTWQRLQIQLYPEGMKLINQVALYENCPEYIFSQQPENGNEYSLDQLNYWHDKIYIPYTTVFCADESRLEQMELWGEMMPGVMSAQLSADIDELHRQIINQRQYNSQSNQQRPQPNHQRPQPNQQHPQVKKSGLGMRMLRGAGRLLAANQRYGRNQQAERAKGQRYYCRKCKGLRTFTHASPTHSCCGQTMQRK